MVIGFLNNLWSMNLMNGIWILYWLSWMHLLSTFLRQWKRKCFVDSALWQQLPNVGNCVWICVFKMTSAKFKPCNEFKPSDILRAGSKLFQSMAVDGKSQFFKKMKFVLIRGMLSMFLVKYWCLFLGVKLKIYWKCLIYDILKIFSVPMSNLEWLQT